MDRIFLNSLPTAIKTFERQRTDIHQSGIAKNVKYLPRFKQLGLIFQIAISHLKQAYIKNRFKLPRIQNFPLLAATLPLVLVDDAISNEELCASVSSFSHNTPNEFLAFLKKRKEQISIRDSELEKEENRTIDFTNPPLTQVVREIKENFLVQKELLVERLKTEFPESNHVKRTHLKPFVFTSSNTNSKINVVECKATADICLQEFCLNLEPNGQGFVDGNWDLVLDKNNLKMWRRPIDHEYVNSQNNLHEYRVIGSLPDVSAQTFLEVQLNLDLRKKWDSNVVNLEPVSNESGTELLHWVSKFPFPMSNREYFFLRRWVLSRAEEFMCRTKKEKETTKCKYPIMALIASRASFTPTEQSCVKNTVRVSDYVSTMLVVPQSQFHDPGMDFYLIYFDDPKLEIPGKTASWITTQVIPRFVDQVHHVSRRIEAQGLPIGIKPVILPPGKSQEDVSIYRNQGVDEEALIKALYGTSLYPSWLPAYYTEAVHTIFT
ncbi:StAR- lipid transfer protein 7, mitochondrial [Cichlidogyrus casuarinus]|uniref:StAR- lipid transfer protein 7, mitochondrial n=1 Tax=Cichlidogyrus casuarinus TaxID=1844966 RepID=A0ABD2QFD6_9PLAT